MPERQSRHPDNALIDQMQDAGTPSQQSRSGGEVNKKVGTRAELERAEGNQEGVTRAVGSDNPSEDAKKGSKTVDAIQREREEG